MSKASAKQLLAGGGRMVRNVYDFDLQVDSRFWFVLKDSFDGMEELSPKVRNCVRRSLKTYDVKRINKDEFQRIALKIYNEALGNYKVKGSRVSQDDIDRMVQQDNLQFWADYNKDTGEAVAVALNRIIDNTCDYCTLKALPKALHDSTFPYYGLLYKMNEYYLSEKGLAYVCDGARTITEHSGIQDFLISKFNFRRAYCYLNLYYTPFMWLSVRVLYPFRRFMPNKIRGVLNLEAMSRGQM